MPKDDGEGRNEAFVSPAASQRAVVAWSTPSRNRSRKTGSKQEATIREARLLRFGGSCNASNLTDKKTRRRLSWTCTACTFVNEFDSVQCGACGANCPIENPSTPVARNLTWTCECCTLENRIDEPICKVCESPNPRKAVEAKPNARPLTLDSDVKTRGTALPPRPLRKNETNFTIRTGGKVKCGACGLQGHNRGTATVNNCPAYHNPEEVELRERKKEKAAEKAREARVEAERLKRHVETNEASQTARLQEMQRLLAEQQRANETSQRIAEGELQRAQKAARRAQSRVRRLDR